MSVEETPEARQDLDNLPAQLKAWFFKQPAIAVPESHHVTPEAKANEQLAEMIGQLQHMVDLLEIAFGRPKFPPLVETMDGQTTVTDYLPDMAHTIASIQVSTDTACTITATLLNRYAPGGKQVIARVVCPIGVTPSLPLDVPVPPADCQIQLTASASPTHCSVILQLQPQIPGGYPYAG